MEPVTERAVRAFLRDLSERFGSHGSFYLLGGSALLLLGSPRETLDVDYQADLEPGTEAAFLAALEAVSAEHRLDVEHVPLAEFIPLPPQAHARHRLVGQFGRLQVFIFDLYSIALSKVARGFETDLEDVLFMLRQNLIELPELRRHFETVLPAAAGSDIIASEFEMHFTELLRRVR